MSSSQASLPMLKVNEGEGERRAKAAWALEPGCSGLGGVGAPLGSGVWPRNRGYASLRCRRRALQIVALKQTDPAPGKPFEHVNPWCARPAFGTLMNRFSLEKEGS